MRTLYIDFETWFSQAVRLNRMTLRNYLARTHILGMAYAIDDGPVEYLEGPALQEYATVLRDIALSDDWAVVAHNAAFDIRVWRFLLNLPQPRHVHCTLELACAAFPNQPGGYSLAMLATTLSLGRSKLTMPKDLNDVKAMAEYCAGDVELCRSLHNLVIPRLHKDEIAVAELANAAREMFFVIDPSAALEAATEFATIARASVLDAISILNKNGDENGQDAFGYDGTDVRSVKSGAMRELLLANLGFETKSISFKKMNPELLRKNQDAHDALKATERTNKALHYRRQVRTFQNVQELDVEMGYFRAHTGRFSSPQPGCRGVNLHNLSKRDKTIAKAIRTIFTLPEDYCFVRADLSNVEYRIEGWLTGCDHTSRIFLSDPLTDPYLAFGYAATGIWFNKWDPIRQVFKAAVLGLGFGMGVERFMVELAKSLADKQFKVSLADLEAVCTAQHWTVPNIAWVKGAQKKARVPDAIAAVAYHMRELFHKVHPEFLRTAKWLEQTVIALNRSLDPAMTLDTMYDLPSAPRRDRLEVLWAGDEYGPGTKSVRVRCGVWEAPTVTWRDLAMRPFTWNGATTMRLSCIQAGKKPPRPLTLSTVIENVSQSAARNALCRGQLKLQDMGYRYQMSVHDEILIRTPKNADAILKARSDILEVFGPGNKLGWDWSVSLNPDEVTVSRSLYEMEMGTLMPPTGTKPNGDPLYPPNSAWWDALPTTPTLLETLP